MRRARTRRPRWAVARRTRRRRRRSSTAGPRRRSTPRDRTRRRRMSPRRPSRAPARTPAPPEAAALLARRLTRPRTAAGAPSAVTRLRDLARFFWASSSSRSSSGRRARARLGAPAGDAGAGRAVAADDAGLADLRAVLTCSVLADAEHAGGGSLAARLARAAGDEALLGGAGQPLLAIAVGAAPQPHVERLRARPAVAHEAGRAVAEEL